LKIGINYLEIMDVEYKLRELLVPVLGKNSIDEIKPEDALVRDLGAESIDFVEILYLIETTFQVKIKIREITMTDYGADGLPEDGRVTPELAVKLNKDFDDDRYKEGQSVADIMQIFSVHNLATVVERKMKEETRS
jgi:acyl carrier protein